MAKDTLEVAVDKRLIEELRECREALRSAEQRAADAEMAYRDKWQDWKRESVKVRATRKRAEAAEAALAQAREEMAAMFGGWS